MQTQTQLPSVLRLDNPTLLPSAVFMYMFMGTRVLYKGKLLNSCIMYSPKGRTVRATEVGDFLYVEQEKYGDNSSWAQLAREGHKILWIIHRPTTKLVGKVVNGKVTQL